MHEDIDKKKRVQWNNIAFLAPRGIVLIFFSWNGFCQITFSCVLQLFFKNRINSINEISEV